jgi:hypothetical protein
VSQTLSWSHFIELVSIEDITKRLFYQQMCIAEHWSVRTLRQKENAMHFERTVIAAKPDDVLVQQLQTISSGNITPDLVFLLGEEYIKVAQYLTALPNKQWFIDKLNKAITIAQQNAHLSQHIAENK